MLHERPAPLALFAAATPGYALVNDIDHCDVTIARSMGFLTEAFARVVRAVSGGHRHGRGRRRARDRRVSRTRG
ncbi:MAG: hypothetical protein ACM3ML_09550 [Micromonosporaceae bacterium]